jgi:hypothetical protein
MQAVQDRLTLWLRHNRRIYFCDGCLALKMGALRREVRDARGESAEETVCSSRPANVPSVCRSRR